MDSSPPSIHVMTDKLNGIPGCGTPPLSLPHDTDPATLAEQLKTDNIEDDNTRWYAATGASRFPSDMLPSIVQPSHALLRTLQCSEGAVDHTVRDYKVGCMRLIEDLEARQEQEISAHTKAIVNVGSDVERKFGKAVRRLRDLDERIRGGI